MTLSTWMQTGCPWCPGGHMGWGGGIVMLIFWLVVLGLIVWLIAVLLRRTEDGDSRRERGGHRAEETLRERYARGEIDEETYRRMLDELRRS